MTNKAFILALLFCATSALAVEKDGLRVDITKKTIARNDGDRSYSYKEVNRVMSLKTTVKNISMNDFPAGQIHYKILIQRWGMMESSNTERYEGSIDLQLLKPLQQQELLVGEYQIRGHMHGNSDRHVDQMVGWKLTFKNGDKETVMMSKSDFDTLDKLAKPAIQ